MILEDESLFNYALITLYLIAPPTFISLTFLQAPYGKHHRPGWGPNLPPYLAWFLMESPTLWFTLYLFPFGNNSSNPKSILLITPFLIHYFNRTCVYPLRLFFTTTKNTSRFPFSIALMAFLFNLLNSYVQARWVSHYKNYDGDGLCFWLAFLCGVLVFFCGIGINVWSDKELLRLKAKGKGYVVPKGGLFEVVSCPNYFGEILEWFGWALMTWSWAGLGFFVYTFANLGPRARANHKWYLEKFGEDYPKKRKAGNFIYLGLTWFNGILFIFFKDYFVLFSWMPVYFKSVYNVNLKQAAWFSAVPWATMAFSGYLAGTASDFLINAGYPTTFVRKLMQTIGFIGPAVTLLCLNYANTPTIAATLLTAALSLSSFSQAGFMLNIQDIAPQYAGILHGKKLSKFVGNFFFPCVWL